MGDSAKSVSEGVLAIVEAPHNDSFSILTGFSQPYLYPIREWNSNFRVNVVVSVENQKSGDMRRFDSQLIFLQCKSIKWKIYNYM
ncbi:hypothetical protein C0674_09060 [Sporolactobacillus terrae]|uniref:Uncharacterized protein n=1 Tax=Sporolactobacillus terrae TaxID=269673 RepID=A0ABX5Q821_9BACL|nr:hypothetical protein C0674_09060 [Sporolactobacillus terrae]QAA25736.1 hypothetical protein C0679_09040 [Sporolactobacillus terrae]